ncbi:putative polysaccharide biosynthesis protein [Halalkalibacter krulwichiae]|uniref:Putative cell division protein YtgP n=1 Tax=Halalkalibacter krulwichiae TaxID=199441 RepID=A0A1X9MDD2_9BACI|nr:polysaccharide biosynthesis protein [Halalkalibacter krulwichiae]ARK28452.1 putative cell division protein YtgP [Halalkalibacter krulwichiae]
MHVSNLQKGKILKGIALLSMVAIVAKILSAAYRIPYQNMAGDLGFYVYQQVYPFYGIVIVLAMYGFPVVLSKQRAELLARGMEREAKQVLSLFFYGLMFFSIVVWALLFFFAEVIATMMGDMWLESPIKAMSYIVLLLPFLSVGRGFHQGEGNLIPTAISHVAEQFIRVLFILGLTYLFVQAGSDAYKIGSGAAYGSVIGAAAGVIILLLLTRARWLRQLIHPFKLDFFKLIKGNLDLFKQSLFICLSALLVNLFQLVDAFSVVRLMQSMGVEQIIAFETKGVYDRSQPLIQLGTILTTTLALALVPMLSKALIEGELELASRYQSLSYRLAFLVGGAATVGLMIILKPTNHMLFTDTAGTDVLTVMSMAILLLSSFTTMAAVLQGYNYAYLPAIAVALGFVIKVISNIFLIPFYGTLGAAWSTVLATLVMVVFLLLSFKRTSHLYLGKLTSYMRISGLLLIMAVVVFLWKYGVTIGFADGTRGADTFIALSSVTVGGLVTVIFLFLLPIFTEEEWSSIPKLNKIRAKVRFFLLRG